MKVQEVEAALKETFPELVFTSNPPEKEGICWSRPVPISGLREVANIFDRLGFFLETVTALDFQDTFELVYHFNCYEARSRVAIRVLCGHEQMPPTLSDIFRGAGWLEREVHDFFGIVFTGNPDLRPLLLPEDADYHPLRKDFGKTGAYHKREDIYG